MVSLGCPFANNAAKMNVSLGPEMRSNVRFEKLLWVQSLALPAARVISSSVVCMSRAGSPADKQTALMSLAAGSQSRNCYDVRSSG